MEVYIACRSGQQVSGIGQSNFMVSSWPRGLRTCLIAFQGFVLRTWFVQLQAYVAMHILFLLQTDGVV